LWCPFSSDGLLSHHAGNIDEWSESKT
jgi:hypothetical protein